jgi:mono/diheme cytochrome c family protein
MATYRTSQRLTTLCGSLLLVFGSGNVLADVNGNWQDGKEVYEKVCAYCHEKGIGPKIKGYGRLPADIIKTVRSGRNAMPAFRQTEIDDAALAKVAEYIK